MNDYKELYEQLVKALGYNPDLIIENNLTNELLKRTEKLSNIIDHETPEKSGKFFICGSSNDLGKDHLPKYIHVCPAHGVDWAKIYKKIDENS